MASINVRLDKADVDAAYTMLEGIKNGFPRAYARALNTTSDGMKTDMVAMARDDYTFKADAVRSRITINRATWSELTASVRSTGKEMHLTDFLSTNQTQKGVTVNIKTSTGRQLVPRTFIAAARNSGKKMVLRRPGNPRGQYQVLYGRYGPPGSGGKFLSKATLDVFYGPHPEIVWNAEHNWEKLSDQASERLKVNFAHEVDYVLQQYG
jgi:hypothetical protein